MKRYFVVFCILFITISFAQIPDTLWTKTYGGTGWDRGYDVQQTVDGGYVIVGYTSSFGAGNSDIYLIKTDANGDTAWTKTYGGTDNDMGYAVRRTNDNGFVIVGLTYSFGHGSVDVYLIKTDSLGDTVWTQTYGGDSIDHGVSVQQTADSGYIIVGATQSFGVGGWDVYVVKTNVNGDTLWTKTYGGAYYDYGKAVQQTSDGGYVIGGSLHNSSDIYLIKTDMQGDTLWTKTYGRNNCYDVLQTPDNGYIIVGHKYFASFNSDVLLIKTDSLGDTLWTRTLGSDSTEEIGYSIDHTTDGGYIITGVTRNILSPNLDAYLIKTDSLGDMLWTKRLGGTGEERGVSVQQTIDNGYVVAGWTSSFGAGNEDIYLIKIEPDSLGIEELITTQPKVFFLDIFPNPFKKKTNIRFQISTTGSVKIQIYDTAGRLIKEFATVAKNLINQVNWDGTDDANRKLPSGVYFLKLEAGDYSAMEKLILLR